MSIFRVILSICVLFPALTFASTATLTPSRVIGLDFAIPYIFTIDGNSYNEADNLDLGLDLHYFVGNNVSMGARFAIDLQSGTAQPRQWIVAPGVKYQWFQGKTWMPYIRTDLPIILKGALNATGSDSQQDVGFIAGFGLAWNIGNQMGIENVLLRYDFTAQYHFGFGDAVGNFGVEFLKVGLEYRF